MPPDAPHARTPGLLRAGALLLVAVLAAAFATLRPAAAAPPGLGAAQAVPAAEEEEHGGDILFRVTSRTQKYSVLYSHESHVAAGIACDECHEKVFKKKLDANKFKMADVNKGLFCGACHNDAPAADVKHPAFAPKKNCKRCHDVLVHDSSAK